VLESQAQSDAVMPKHINNAIPYPDSIWVSVLSLREVTSKCWIQRACKGSSAHGHLGFEPGTSVVEDLPAS